MSQQFSNLGDVIDAYNDALGEISTFGIRGNQDEAEKHRLDVAFAEAEETLKYAMIALGVYNVRHAGWVVLRAFETDELSVVGMHEMRHAAFLPMPSRTEMERAEEVYFANLAD